MEYSLTISTQPYSLHVQVVFITNHNTYKDAAHNTYTDAAHNTYKDAAHNTYKDAAHNTYKDAAHKTYKDTCTTFQRFNKENNHDYYFM